MKRGEDALVLTGIPRLHAIVFQNVANATGCMISTRAVGKWATGLILEGYASKGFHNKAKSCNWGPMAGFVLADPRFTKAPELDKQAKSLQEAFHEGAVEVPVVISEDRRRWLLTNACMQPSAAIPTARYYFASSPQGEAMLFVLQAELDVPGANGELMWSVKYARAEGRVSSAAPTQAEKAQPGDGYLPVLAMRDPLCTVAKSDYRSATTGDYDLFAIFARAQGYSPADADKRMVSHAALEANIRNRVPDTGEDKHLGNVTRRIVEIRNELNRGIIQFGYTGGNTVHHSDEGGRPFVNDVDLPVLAFVPDQIRAYGIESVEDFREFISVTLAGYAPVLSPGWMKQLVFHPDPKTAAKIHSELMTKIAARRT